MSTSGTVSDTDLERLASLSGDEFDMRWLD
jgi:hypothetical protein